MPEPGNGQLRPEQVLQLQETLGNAAVARSLRHGDLGSHQGGAAMLLRDRTAVDQRPQLKAAARRVASVSGTGVDKALEELQFYVDNGMAEASVVRAATTIAGLAGKAGAALYAALRKMPAGDAEAYWVVALLVEAKQPELTTAVRLVRGYRGQVWFDLADVFSRDPRAGRLFVESLTVAEVDAVWAQVEKQPKLTPDARAEIAEAITAMHADATKADLDATAKLLARATGIGVAELREKLETVVAGGIKSADLKRLAPEVLRLGKLKVGKQLLEALLQFSDPELEALVHMANRLGPKYERLGSASELVMWFKSRTWWAFAGQYERDPVAGELLLDTLPPAELDQVWVALGRVEPDKPTFAPDDYQERQTRVRGRVKGALKRAGEGDSERAVSERLRGKETGEKLEKRVDSVLGQAKFRRQEILTNIERGSSTSMRPATRSSSWPPSTRRRAPRSRR